MGKATSNGCETGVAIPERAVHFVLQGKGGVGKSVVASWLAEFLIQRGKPVRCIDGDPVNRSFAQYKALAAESFELTNDAGLIERWRYDALVERFATTDAVYVLDTGATTFLPLWGYIVESEMIAALGTSRPKSLPARSHHWRGDSERHPPRFLDNRGRSAQREYRPLAQRIFRPGSARWEAAA